MSYKYIKEKFCVSNLDEDGEIEIGFDDAGENDSDVYTFLTKEEAKELADFIYRELKELL